MDVAIAYGEELQVESAQRRKTRRWDIFLQLNFLLPVTVLVLMVFAAIFAGQIAPYDPLQTSLSQRLQPPAFAGGTSAHLLGTDKLGRDILSRIMPGIRKNASTNHGNT